MILAASGIILDNKKILLLKRSNYTERYPGFWGCPGGRTEKGETAVQNVIREVKEECNLDFTPTKIIKTGVWQGKKYYRFLGNWTGEIKIQEEEVADYNWFSFSEAANLKLSFDYKEIIEILHQQKLL
ncbi:NUDIX domain-containing protein [Lutibacter sp. A80]|uniref:NUDIX hydrolase n=1 Tax=Lutibacter sp. A80 TaxID=2918453 RepID=UPI001F05BE26|nr:NUDIX domain-containing protein [Lutibacter sp. A80]UMB60449.1 NUDIX domain-containing protein [Lutibacter sp. A80]